MSMSGKKHKSVFNFWNNISISAKLYFVVGLMAGLIIIELLTLRFAMGNLSAVRAFVGGEASWSKAQKNAVYHFQRYAMNNKEEDYHAFYESLKIPDGDRMARTELMKPDPDMKIVHAGFIQGHVHPEDVVPVVKLLSRFYWVSYIEEAVKAWTEGDALLLELREVAFKYHALNMMKDKDLQQMHNLQNKVIEINHALTKVEETFSRVLGEGSRWMERIVFMVLFILVITIESIGLTLTFFTSRSLSRGLTELNKISEEFGVGNFQRRLAVSSGDEIGLLTQSVNKMGDMLQKSYNDLINSHKELEHKVHERTVELAKIANQNSLLYDEARNAIKMRDDFLSIASHEIRTPLTALKMQIYLIEKASAKESDNPQLEQISKTTKRASVLIKKLSTLQEVLMDLAQIRLGKIEIKRVETNITDVISETVGHLMPDANRLGIEVSLEYSDTIIGVIDPLRLSQVATNLINNAIKYGDGKPIEVKVFKEDDFVVIKVKDHGPGIAFDKQNKIFERFERVNDDPAVSGLGLGLFISKQIVEAHGGSIFIESALGNGAVFTAKFLI